jgi:hypothetical protein
MTTLQQMKVSCSFKNVYERLNIEKSVNLFSDILKARQGILFSPKSDRLRSLGRTHQIIQSEKARTKKYKLPC